MDPYKLLQFALAITMVFAIAVCFLGWKNIAKSAQYREKAKRISNIGTTPITFLFLNGQIVVFVNGAELCIAPGTIQVLDLSESSNAVWTIRPADVELLKPRTTKYYRADAGTRTGAFGPGHRP